MLSNALTNAVTVPYVRHFAAVQINLANTGSTINLCDGSGWVTFGGMTFLSNDPTYGTLVTIAAMPSAVLTSSPSTEITLMPASTDGVAALADPQNQLSTVTVWWGAIDEAAGAVIDTQTVWSGNLDFVKINSDATSRTVVLTVITGLDKLWPSDEGMRVNDQSHQTIYPGETGLSQVIAGGLSPTWGAAAQQPIYPILTLAPTVGDVEAGITSAGKSSGRTWAPSGQGG
jgi:hypothetical protein